MSIYLYIQGYKSISNHNQKTAQKRKGVNMIRTRFSYSRKINNRSKDDLLTSLIFFWIFFLGALANIGYSIFVFIVEPQPIAFLGFYFGVVYLLIALVCFVYYWSNKNSHGSI